MEMANSQNKQIAELVRQRRTERLWPQSQLAEVADLSLRTIQRLEKDGVASYETLAAVADALDIDPKTLASSSKQNVKRTPQLRVHLLPRLAVGKDITDVIGDAHEFQVEHDQIDSKKHEAFMVDFLQEIKNDIVRWHDGDQVEKLKIEFGLSHAIKELEGVGFYLFGIKREIPKIAGEQRPLTKMCTLYMSHSCSPKIIRDKKFNMAIPAVLPEVAR